MTTDRELARRAHGLLMEAMELVPELRRKHVRQAAAGDAALQELVLQMVGAADAADSFLERPVLRPPDPQLAGLPDAIGNYLIVGVLGSGGMATVYEAIQESPKRRVALKVLHQSMVAGEQHQRFRFETEALARLHHPAIAQIYEAGTAHLGPTTASPFFAMELVADALPLTEFCERKKLSLADRLRLFTTVCDAVHHGHQNGLIHRDIKPANVLVDGEGRPKVIDFGIARATESPAGSPHAVTGHRQLIGTLHAMSPEQCDSSRDVDIRTDIYSLGVMLYQLVAGRRPLDLTDCSVPDAIRMICQVEPPPASRFRREAAGDLDAILGMAMDKDRERRYPSAAALAADLRRHLGQLPIEARPATALLQLKKFVRRNRPLAIASFAALLLLLAGTALIARLAWVEMRARQAAEQRERQLEAVTEFQASLLRDINVTEMGDRLRQALAESVANSPDTGPEQSANPNANTDFGRWIEPVNFTSLAVKTLHESILQGYGESIRRNFRDEPVLQAQLLQQLATTLNTLGLHTEAEPVLREALELRTARLGRDDADTLLTLHSLGSLLSTLGRYDEAVVCLREAYDRRSKNFGPEHLTTLRSGTSLGGVYRRQGKLDQAEQIWSRTLAGQRRLLGDDDPETLRSLNNMGVVFASQGRMEEAETCWRELLERRRRLLGEDHPDCRGTLGNLCTLLLDQGKLDAVRPLRPLVEKALAADRRDYGDLHSNTLMTMIQLAELRLETGDAEAAEALQRECLAGRTIVFGPDSAETLLAQTSLASMLLARGEHVEAEAQVRSALRLQRQSPGDDHPDTIDTINLLSRILGASGQLDEALLLSEEAIGRAKRILPPAHWTNGRLLSDHGALLLAAGRVPEALPFLEEGYGHLLETLGEHHALTLEAARHLEEGRESADRMPDSGPENPLVRGAN
jgi:eukaryotic-like serine/threonine-protein kinase